jgi:hypothetical protein
MPQGRDRFHEKGKQTGPLTVGEAHTLASMIVGCDPDDIGNFVLLSIHACTDCDAGHHIGMNTDLAPEDVFTVLTSAVLAHVAGKF